MRFLILLFLYCSAAMATYDERCMKLLVRPRPPLIDSFHQKMMESVNLLLPEGLDPARLTPVDYEVIYDIYHDLPLIAVMSDGARIKLGADRGSLAKLMANLRTVNVIQALYLPEALAKVRLVLREACVHMNQRDCGSYDTYMGLMDNRARIFSRREEQAIKWATIYQLPTHYTANNLKLEPVKDLDRKIAEMRDQRLEISEKILSSVFSPVNSAEIFELFAHDYISDSFGRLKNMVNGNVIVLTR